MGWLCVLGHSGAVRRLYVPWRHVAVDRLCVPMLRVEKQQLHLLGRRLVWLYALVRHVEAEWLYVLVRRARVERCMCSGDMSW